MAKAHTIHAAKTQVSRLITRASRSEEVIIARGSQPVAKLVMPNVPEDCASSIAPPSIGC